ncbi:hypothetical protein AMATHDRAFT_1853 [Amanita thiersii Skay4041]|uniref:Uncharacterized protein n=1 Tax=Amanita thiersii Skay4041 TaxID=703135 RepID=A0A2A9NY28_9AGAR|nr:hypothetical protein AMATHDRAFT_1853 [Amanita thiersii Skay4041]
MFSSLDFDVRPGNGLGMFDIGSSLWTVLETLRGLQHVFPQVDIKYDPDVSTTSPIIVHIRPHLDLLFSGRMQRLHTICVRELRDPNPPITLRYKDTILSSKEEALQRLGVSRSFGPTYSGEDLRYPGISFSFNGDNMADTLKAAKMEDRTQEVKKVTITQRNDQEAIEEVRECRIMNGDIARAVAKVHEGVTLHFYPSSSSPAQIRLNETTAQDLILALGPPSRVHYKEDERMMIHASSSNSTNSEAGYFHNYFQHGIDFFISSSSHIVKKILLHTNVVGSPLFQRYKRCCWEIEGAPEDDEDGNVPYRWLVFMLDTPPRKRFYDRFETISHFLSPNEPPPSMVLNRTDDDNLITLPNAATRLYGYDGIVLEVSESSQVLAVMLV